MTTTSRVLGGRATPIPVSESTRRQIAAAAAELGYQPNLLARALRSSRTGILGLVTADISSSWVSEIVSGADRRARERGYHLVFSSQSAVSSDSSTANGAVQHLSLVDGLLIVVSGRCEWQSLAGLASQHQYVVAIVPERVDLNARCVRVDVEGCVGQALEHLHALGHRRVALITDPRDWTLRPSLEAYRAFVHRRDLESVVVCVEEDVSGYEGGSRAAESLLAGAEPPTAILAAEDRMAIGAMHAISRAGRRVPDDVSVVGVDDIPVARYVAPALTTVRRPLVEMGDAAAALLAQIVEGKGDPSTDSSSYREVALESELVIRGSTGPPPRA